ncbi:MAG: hypothetical protein U5P10_00510 [Spirochaetia bacterium]|nr:hypothetical protein [Spirochaetia bacterium]
MTDATEEGIMRKSILLLSSVFMILLPSVLYGQTEALERLEDEPPEHESITIVYTSDLQQRLIESIEGDFGLVELSAAVKYARQQYNLILLDAGGSRKSDTRSAMEVQRYDEGRQLYAKILDETGYDAQIPGSAEFAWGIHSLRELDQSTSFPILCANIETEIDSSEVDEPEGTASGASNPFEGYQVFTFEGIKVGVFGITSPKSIGLLEGEHATPTFHITDPIAAAEQALAKLKAAGAEVIIAVTHIGLFDLYERGYFDNEDIKRAEQRLSGRVDLIIDGGNSSRENPDVYQLGKTVIARTGGASSIGDAEISVKNREVTGIDIRMIDKKTIEEAGFEPMPEVVSLIDRLSVAMDTKTQTKTAEKPEEEPAEQIEPKKEQEPQEVEKDSSEELDPASPPEEEKGQEGSEAQSRDREVDETDEEGFVMPQLELFFIPGLTLYSGATGYGLTIGAMSDLEELFGLSSPAGNVMLGLLLRYDGLSMSAENLNLNSLGPALIAGYILDPSAYLAEITFLEGMRVMPRLTLGGMSLDVSKDGRSAHSGFSAYLAPGVLIDKKLPFEIDLRAGLSAEYNITFGNTVWRSFHTGAFVSWTY